MQVYPVTLAFVARRETVPVEAENSALYTWAPGTEGASVQPAELWLLWPVFISGKGSGNGEVLEAG